MEIGNSQLVVQIDGRDAIPVRAIPYVTGWKLSPDEIAQQLAHRAGPQFARLENVAAYHMQAGSPVKMLPKEWDAHVVQLTAFGARLREKYSTDTNGSQGYAAWRNGSAELLPAGVFVWRDEFESDFRHDFSRDVVTFSDERLLDRDLIDSPVLADDVRTMVLAGFHAQQVAIAGDPPTLMAPDDRLPVVQRAVMTDDSLLGQKPVSRGAAQDAAILEALRGIGIDPAAIPIPPAGKNGIKAQVRAEMNKLKDVFVSNKVFENAWQRLREQGDIRDEKPSS
jgi:hypothetical protein